MNIWIALYGSVYCIIIFVVSGRNQWVWRRLILCMCECVVLFYVLYIYLL